MISAPNYDFNPNCDFDVVYLNQNLKWCLKHFESEIMTLLQNYNFSNKIQTLDYKYNLEFDFHFTIQGQN